MSEWKNFSLGDVCKFIDYRGKTPPKVKSGVPLVTAKIIKNGLIQEPKEFIAEEFYSEWMRRGIPKKGDVIFTTEAPLGEVAQIKTDRKLAFAQRVIILESDDDILCSSYLFYALQDIKLKSRIEARQSGTTVSGIKASELRKVEIDLPPLETQKKIAAVLSALDDKIELNNAINKNIEEQTQAIFKHMFPAVISNEISIGEYVTPKRGKGLLVKDTIFGDVPVVAGGIEPATYHNESNTSAPVLTISASGANAGYVRLWNIPVWSSDSSFIDSNMTEDVYFWYVMLKLRQKEIFDSQTGTAQPHIYPKHIAQLLIKKLDEHRIEEFTKRVTPLFLMIGENIQENQKLGELRDALLPRLMNGEIDVSEVEI